jgi:hypothetical protein
VSRVSGPQRLADCLPDYVTHPDALTGTAALRGRPVDGEERVAARLPGDAEEHLLHTEPNSFISMPFSVLKRMREDPSLTDGERQQAAKALALQRCSHQGNVPAPARNIND